MQNNTNKNYNIPDSGTISDQIASVISLITELYAPHLKTTSKSDPNQSEETDCGCACYPGCCGEEEESFFDDPYALLKEARVNGKQIQLSTQVIDGGECDQWIDIDNPLWTFAPSAYRIKPSEEQEQEQTPVEEYEDDHCCGNLYDPYSDLKEAFKNNKTIQILNCEDKWVDVESPTWRKCYTEYRIKPEESKTEAVCNSGCSGSNDYFKHLKHQESLGRTIQIYFNGLGWRDICNPFYLLNREFYRIKPE